MQNIELAYKLAARLEKARQTLEKVEAFEYKILRKFKNFIKKEYGNDYSAISLNYTPKHTENLIYDAELSFDFYVGEMVGYARAEFDYKNGEIPENRVTHIYRTNLQIGIYFDETISKKNYIREKFAELLDEFLYEEEK